MLPDGADSSATKPSATSSACTGCKSKAPPAGRGRTLRRASLINSSQLVPPRPYTTDGRAMAVSMRSATASSPRPLLARKGAKWAASAPSAESCTQRRTPASRAQAASRAGVRWWTVSKTPAWRLITPTQFTTASQPANSGMAASWRRRSKSRSACGGVRTLWPASRRRRAVRRPIKPPAPSSRMFMGLPCVWGWAV